MHDTTLAHRVASVAESRASELGLGRVSAIHIRLAAWADIEPDELREEFDNEARGGPAEGAELRIELVQPCCRCRDCGAVFQPRGFTLRCQSCGSTRVELEQPSELEVVSVKG